MFLEKLIKKTIRGGKMIAPIRFDTNTWRLMNQINKNIAEFNKTLKKTNEVLEELTKWIEQLVYK